MQTFQPSRFAQRLFAWLALSTILFGALAPTVARAMAGPEGMLEVCTVNGIKLVAATGSGSDTSSHADTDKHCPFCTANHASLGLPPSTEPVLRLPVTSATFHPERYFTAARPLFIWAHATPRAPPLLSA